MRAAKWIVLLALLCLPLLLLFSEAGARLALHLTARFTGMEIDYGGGTLTGALHVHALRVQEPGVTVAVRDISLQLDERCLWRSVVCLPHLEIGAVDITLAQGEDATHPDTGTRGRDEVSTGTSNPQVRFPVAVEAPHTSIGATRVRWGSGQWQQGPASLAVTLNESGIQVDGATIQRARLELGGGEDSAPGQGLPSIALPLALTVTDLALTEPALLMGERRYDLAGLRLSGHWQQRELQLQHLALESAELGQFTLREGALTFVDAWPLRAAVELRAGPATPWPALNGRTASIALDGDLGALAFRVDAPGEPPLEGSGRIDLLEAGLPFEATATLGAGDALRLSTFSALPPRLADIQLLPPVAVSAQGTLERQRLTVDTAANIPDYGALDIRAEASHAAGRLIFDELLLRGRDGAGELSADGEVSWREGVHWSLAARSSGLELPTLAQPLRGRLRGELRSSGTVTDTSWAAAISGIDLEGEINGRPARVTGNAALANGELRHDSDLRGQLAGALLRLRPLPVGKGSELSLEVADLKRWHPELGGRLHLQGRIEAGGERLALDGELSGLRWRELNADAGTVSADYAADKSSAFNTRVELSGVRWREIDLDALTVSASGDTERVQATLHSTGDMQAQLDAAASRHEDGWQGQLAPAQVRTGNMTWSLAEPVALALSADRDLHIGAHCWHHAAARLCPGEWAVGRAGRGSIELAGDLSQLSRLLPPDTELDGELQAEGQVSWNDSAPLRADINIEVQPLVLTRVLGEGERQQIRWSRATATASLRDGALSAQAAVHRDAEPPKLVLDIALPTDRDGALHGSLVADGLRLGALTGLVPGVGATGGTLNGRLRLTGSARRPRLEGTLALDDGLLKMTGNPTLLENLDLELRARGDSARLSGTGRLGGGELLVEGDLITEPAPHLTLRLRGSDNNILYPPSADLRASHELQASVTSGRLSVSGDITIHDGVLEYAQLPDHGVPLSADVVRVDEVGSDIADAAPLAVDMDVRVRIQEDFRLQGPQLEAALSGNLRLIGKPREPLQVFGSLQTAGGTASAYERTLEIKRGVVSFSGPPDNPNLDLRAQRRISGSNITAGLHVHGDLGSDLALDVYSDPPMSQSEAMSYLIWGRPPDSGNTGDGTALALSLAGTVVNRSGLVSTINEVPGISNVSFGAEGSEADTAATVSGYVGERLYLSYGIGIYEPVNVLTARFFLRTRLWLEVVSRLENSLDLYYSFDLD